MIQIVCCGKASAVCVQTLYSQGILTIVDMHQDFYSRWLNLGCGEGFPRWAILVDPILQKNPWNGPTCVAWILQVSHANRRSPSLSNHP